MTKVIASITADHAYLLFRTFNKTMSNSQLAPICESNKLFPLLIVALKNKVDRHRKLFIIVFQLPLLLLYLSVIREISIEFLQELFSFLLRQNERL